MSAAKKPPIYGLKFVKQSNPRGDRDLPVRFGSAFRDSEVDLAAMTQVGTGERGRWVVTGHYDKGEYPDGRAGVFVAEEVDFIPDSEDRGIDDIWCPLVIEALKTHLKHGDPNEAIFHSGKEGSMTAQRVLEMLITKDPRALSFVRDLHGAALRAVRVRKRAPLRGPKR